jgi:MFS family permease
MGVGGYVLPVFLKPVTADLGWSRTDFALANPIMSTAVALAGPMVGWLSDRRGARSVLAVGSVGMSLALLGAGRTTRPVELYAAAFALGLAVACLGDLPTGAAIAGRFRKQRGLALALVYIGSNIGGALVAVVATLLATGSSWRHAFTLIGAVLWLVLFPSALSLPRTQRQPAKAASGDEPAAEDGVPLASAVRQRDFWLLFWVLFVFYFYRLGMNVHLVAYLSDIGYSSLEAAGGLSLTLALGIGGKLLAGTFADRVGARAAVVGNFSIIAVASALLLTPRLPGAVPAFLVLHGFATAAEDVVVPLVIGQRFGTKNLARIYGVLLLTLIPGGAIGPVLAGRLFDTTGSYTPVFAIFLAGNLTAVAALVAVRMRPEATGTEPHPLEKED